MVLQHPQPPQLDPRVPFNNFFNTALNNLAVVTQGRLFYLHTLKYHTNTQGWNNFAMPHHPVFILAI